MAGCYIKRTGKKGGRGDMKPKIAFLGTAPDTLPD